MSFMLVVRVELWPGGRQLGSRELGRAGIANVSELADRSDYLVVRLDASGTNQGVVRGHRRTDGFWPLVSRSASTLSDVVPPAEALVLQQIGDRLRNEALDAAWRRGL